MKVTFLTGEYPPMQGGIADYTAHLARSLLPLDVQPAILISRLYKRYEAAGAPGGPKSNFGPIPIHPYLSGWGIRCWPEIKRFLRQHPSQVLHIQYQAAAFDLAGWINWLPWFMRLSENRPKIVTTFHDLRIPYLFPKAGPLRWRSILALARYSDAVICTNREDALTLRQFAWGDHIAEIPLGNNVPVNPPSGYDRQRWRDQLGLADGAVVLAYFGFLNESKGGEDLIAVLAALVRQEVDAYLLMIGGDVGDSDPSNRAYARRVRQMIAGYDLDQRIIFTGYVTLPEVSANLLAADMAVMPYRDGVSFRRTTLIAALQHGLPIISTRPVVELPQIMAGENMCLARPTDINRLTQLVVQVASQPALREQLSQGAKQLGGQFDWGQIATKTARLYQDIGSSHAWQGG